MHQAASKSTRFFPLLPPTPYLCPKHQALEKHTLYELNEYVRRIIALNLPDPLWVSCEIAQANEARGHCFLSLVQKDSGSDQVVAQAEGVIWQSRLRKLRRKEFDAWRREAEAREQSELEELGRMREQGAKVRR